MKFRVAKCPNAHDLHITYTCLHNLMYVTCTWQLLEMSVGDIFWRHLLETPLSKIPWLHSIPLHHFLEKLLGVISCRYPNETS